MLSLGKRRDQENRLKSHKDIRGKSQKHYPRELSEVKKIFNALWKQAESVMSNKPRGTGKKKTEMTLNLAGARMLMTLTKVSSVNCGKINWQELNRLGGENWEPEV